MRRISLIVLLTAVLITPAFGDKVVVIDPKSGATSSTVEIEVDENGDPVEKLIIELIAPTDSMTADSALPPIEEEEPQPLPPAVIESSLPRDAVTTQPRPAADTAITRAAPGKRYRYGGCPRVACAILATSAGGISLPGPEGFSELTTVSLGGRFRLFGGLTLDVHGQTGFLLWRGGFSEAYGARVLAGWSPRNWDIHVGLGYERLQASSDIDEDATLYSDNGLLEVEGRLSERLRWTVYGQYGSGTSALPVEVNDGSVAGVRHFSERVIGLGLRLNLFF